MGLPAKSHFLKGWNSIQFLTEKLLDSMCQNYQQSIFSFSDGFGRLLQEERQIQPDKLTHNMRVQDFEAEQPLVDVEDVEKNSGSVPAYEPAGMLSEMFTFSSASELLENRILYNYRNPRVQVPETWYQNRQTNSFGNSKNRISNINVDSAEAMQLFLMNPQQRSPSPSSSHHHPPPPSTPTILYPLLPNSASPSNFQPFHHLVGGSPAAGQTFAGAYETNPSEIPGQVEGKSLSLSLSSSLQTSKPEDLSLREGGMLFFGQGGVEQSHQLHSGWGSSTGAVNLLRNSRYVKAVQELLEEFCSVRKDQFKNTKKDNKNPSTNPRDGGGATSSTAASGGGNSESLSKDLPPLSAADRLEHQRRKVKLLSMLDEVQRRYNNYTEQMQAVVNSFDMVMGFGAAAHYTSLAQKAMSRHFRCLKDAISSQLKHCYELLGEKDASTSGLTKGKTPRLRVLEQSLRSQQRAYHQMGMLEPEAWRPQRGLPEKSINILRAWLFEHFLHPYPSDADKHLLARQTGLSRNQVSNWFINARVRLWKPMIEEMYQQEAKEQAQADDQTTNPATSITTKTTAAATTLMPASMINTPSIQSESYVPDDHNDPSMVVVNASSTATTISASAFHESDTCHRIIGLSDYGASDTNAANADIESTLLRFGMTTAGDVSLSLGLHHAGNIPENTHFSVRDFGAC